MHGETKTQQTTTELRDLRVNAAHVVNKNSSHLKQNFARLITRNKLYK